MCGNDKEKEVFDSATHEGKGVKCAASFVLFYIVNRILIVYAQVNGSIQIHFLSPAITLKHTFVQPNQRNNKTKKAQTTSAKDVDEVNARKIKIRNSPHTFWVEIEMCAHVQLVNVYVVQTKCKNGISNKYR